MLNLKTLEYVGTIFAAIGFTLLSIGLLYGGFILGVISCLFLISFFKIQKLNALLALQCFFLCANILGIYNNF